MATEEVTMTAKVHRNYMVIIPLHARTVLGLAVGDFVEMKVRKLEPVKNEAKEPENKEPIRVTL